jgi:hypothetical protein
VVAEAHGGLHVLHLHAAEPSQHLGEATPAARRRHIEPSAGLHLGRDGQERQELLDARRGRGVEVVLHVDA